jgi:GDP-D-mannose 3',5'-epimerase
MKKALVTGAGGFIGGHLCCYLRNKGYFILGVDIKEHEYTNLWDAGCTFSIQDLRDSNGVFELIKSYQPDVIYQLAADMGGSLYVFSGINDADIMHNSAKINLNVVDAVVKSGLKPRIFYSSSACIYPEFNQMDPNNPVCAENTAFPAFPDSEYGWEKLFSERLYLAYARNKGLDVRIARFHNIFGPKGTYKGGKEKAPAALCRKVVEAKDGDVIEIWGPGTQTRSFLYIDECIEGVDKLMNSDFVGPINIGSEELISINDLAKMVIQMSGKNLSIKNISGPTGVMGRCSDNKLIQEKLGWAPSRPLIEGMQKTYEWIKEQVENSLIA